MAIVISKEDADEQGAEHVLTIWSEGPGNSLSRPIQSTFTFDGDDHYFVQQFIIPVAAAAYPVTFNFHATLDYKRLTDVPVIVEFPQGD